MLVCLRRFFSVQPVVTFTPFFANTLSDNPGARPVKKLRGRGPGSGLGKTSGRGMNGHNSRSGGGVKPSFEGGQTPLGKRVPKWGFSHNAFKDPLKPINFHQVYYAIAKGRLSPEEPITVRSLFEAGCFARSKHGVKLLAKGLNRIDQPLHFQVTEASQAAIDAVKAKGGSVTLIYKTKKQLEYHLKPYRFALPMNETAMPPPYTVLKLEAFKARGAEVVYMRPTWIDNWVPPQFPEIPPHEKKPRPQLYRRIDFSSKN